MKKRRKKPKKYRSSKADVAIYAGITLAIIAAVILLIVFFAVPFVKDLLAPLPTVRYTPGMFIESVNVDERPTVIEQDLSELQNEAKISYSTVNDPFFYGDEIIFSTATVKDGITVYDEIVIHNVLTQEESKPGISLKYENAVGMVMNEDYIAWCDADSENGGRICGYVRKTGEQFHIKDYVYATPRLSLEGNIICFMQQAGDTLDRLYLYNLETREALTYKVFSELGGFPTSVDICKNTLVYAIPSDDAGYKLMVTDLTSGEESEINTGRSVVSPKTNGELIAFLSSASGAATDLYLIAESGPVLVENGVVNFDMCDAGIVYSKEDSVYLYKPQEKQSTRLNSQITRAYLAGAQGENVWWYDITSGYGDSADTVKYARIKADG